MLPPVCVLALFSIGTATSKSIVAVLVTRFFGGIFGSAPISNVSAALGDIYTPENRGSAMSFYAICVVGGPALSPLLGASITVNKHMGWRCT
jgi:MFS family permease